MAQVNRPTPIPAAPASVDVGRLVRSLVVEALEEKAADVARGGRFRDESRIDEFGRHHERGGFWNSDVGHAVAGYGKGDVDEICRTLRARGIRVAPVDIDALLGQIVLSGRLDDAVLDVAATGLGAVRLDDDEAPKAEPEPQQFRVRNFVGIEQAPGTFLVRPVVDGDLRGTHVVTARGDVVVCTCRMDPCAHASVVSDHRRAIEVKSTGTLLLSDAEHTIVARRIVAILKPRGLFVSGVEKRRRGNQPRSVPARALQLLLRALLGSDYVRHVDAAALVRYGVIDAPAGSTSLDRYRDDAAVVDLLRDIRGVATRGLRGRGIDVASLIAETNRGDLIAADIVQALRLDARLTNLPQLVQQETTS